MATRRRKSLFPNQPNSPLQPSRSLAIPVEPVAPPLLILAILATTGALGTLYSLFTPAAVIESRSRTPASALNAAAVARAAVLPRVLPYVDFADKRNVVNQLFVKKGWFWTSLLAGIFIIVSYAFPPTLSMRPPSPSHPESDANDLGSRDGEHPWTAPLPLETQLSPLARKTIIISHIRRLGLSTAYWWLLTQSTLRLPLSHGPSLTKHILIRTGGFCVGPGGRKCAGKTGEYYKGGHDVSGHTFLLV